VNLKNFPYGFKTTFVLEEIFFLGSFYRLITNELLYGNLRMNGHNPGKNQEVVKECLLSCWMKRGLTELILFGVGRNSPEKIKVY
jgi:hypothetical protein